MSAIVMNIKNFWKEHSGNAVDAVKRELDEMEKSWVEVETFWVEHPEECFEPFIPNF